jgi:predicted regulator of Ras-like GTPase activity (Roadblock/LC7/MglB family)
MRKLAAVLAGLLVPAFLLAVVAPAVAQDKAKPLEVKNKVLLENDKVKASELTYAPGAENKAVASSTTRIVRAMKGGTLQRTYADGKKEDVVWKAGDVKQLTATQAYNTKNTGKTEVQLYIVQLK